MQAKEIEIVLGRFIKNNKIQRRRDSYILYTERKRWTYRDRDREKERKRKRESKKYVDTQ